MGQDESSPSISNFRVLKRRNGKLIHYPLIKVVLRTGDSQEEFQIHKNIITAKSAFFRSALSGCWTNSESRTVTLEHLNPRYFDMYLNTVYKRQVEFPDPLHHHQTAYQDMAEAYVIAEEMMDYETKNLLLVAMGEALFANDSAEGRRMYPRDTHINIIYRGTSSAANGARRWLVKVWTILVTEGWMAEHGPTLPRDFLIELSCELVVQRPTLPMSTRPLGSEIDMADFMETDPEEQESEGQDGGDEL